MKIKDFIKQNIKLLPVRYPEQEIADILGFVLRKDKTYIYLYADNELNAKQIEKAKKLITRRAQNEPFAYILKSQPFKGLDFYVNQNVLIPRPATEELIDIIANDLKTNNKNINIVDIGTGSGCIIITLAKLFQNRNWHFFASDKSKASLKVAQRNAKDHKLETIITFKQGCLLSAFTSTKFDIIIANLPYLTTKEVKQSPTAAELAYEPQAALIAPDDGLLLIKELIVQAKTYLNKSGTIYLEIGHNQAKKLSRFCKTIFPDSQIKIDKDNCGFDRFIKISI